MDSPPAPRAIAALLLLSTLLLGLGQAALLPAWEGFDEHGHYSYIQQVADTGHWTRQDDPMSRDIDDYLKIAPTADALPRQWSYYPFFAAPADVIATARNAIQSPRPQPRAWTPGTIENWQSQHPPLYYYVLAPVYRATRTLSFAGQLFALRAFSYLLAWAGLCIVAVAALRGAIPERGAMPALFAAGAWPLLFPMWFPQMGRLGNDSLIVIFAACLFVLAWRVTPRMAHVLVGEPVPTSPEHARGRMRDHVLVGVVLGLGLLTKATFLPVAAAMFLLLAIQALRARNTPGAFFHRAKGICVTAALMLAVCGWWYLYKLIGTGSLIGSSDVIRMQASGGMIAGLMKNLAAEQVLRMPWEFAVSFFWSGTWSFVRPPRIFMLPLIVAAAMMACGLYASLRRQGIRPVDGFALLTGAFFLAGILYHSAVVLSTASGTAPAYYLHSLAPIFALLVGYGMFELMRSPWLRGLFAALMLYPLLFLAAITATSALYFAGCAPKLPGRLYFALSSAAECVADFPRMYDNLSVLALPGPAIGFFVTGWIIAVIAMTMTVRYLQTSITSTR